MLTFEVRIPTYNRPDLLRRALESLQAQTYHHWIATVFDDATSGEEVVHTLADRRIQYERNPQQLGAALNIDQGFSPISRSGGHYGSLLEDDNFWMPEFLACIAQHLEERRWHLIQSNQRIWSEDRGLYPDNETTFGDWFNTGAVDQDRLWASRLVGHGLSNGGLIWALGGELNLQVGPKIKHAGIQELCRSLLVRSPFLFVQEALAVFTYMPKEATARSNEDNRLFGRGYQSIRRFILARLGAEMVMTVLAEKAAEKDSLVQVLAHSGYTHLIESREIVSRRVLKAYLKGIALRMTQRDPCSDFLTGLR